jgi:hypothetical protein
LPAAENLVWGFESQVLISLSLCPRPSFFVLVQVSLFDLEAVSSPRPTDPGRCRAQGLSRLAVAPTLPRAAINARPYLDSSEHDGTLAEVGMTITRGARYRARLLRAATLYSVGREDPDHDALMRIGGEAPRRQAHSAQRHESQGFHGSPPPRIVIGDPSRSSGWSRKCYQAQAMCSADCVR